MGRESQVAARQARLVPSPVRSRPAIVRNAFSPARTMAGVHERVKPAGLAVGRARTTCGVSGEGDSADATVRLDVVVVQAMRPRGAWCVAARADSAGAGFSIREDAVMVPVAVSRLETVTGVSAARGSGLGAVGMRVPDAMPPGP